MEENKNKEKILKKTRKQGKKNKVCNWP